MRHTIGDPVVCDRDTVVFVFSSSSSCVPLNPLFNDGQLLIVYADIYVPALSMMFTPKYAFDY